MRLILQEEDCQEGQSDSLCSKSQVWKEDMDTSFSEHMLCVRAAAN